jgi:hypothetical protein
MEYIQDEINDWAMIYKYEEDDTVIPKNACTLYTKHEESIMNKARSVLPSLHARIEALEIDISDHQLDQVKLNVKLFDREMKFIKFNSKYLKKIAKLNDSIKTNDENIKFLADKLDILKKHDKICNIPTIEHLEEKWMMVNEIKQNELRKQNALQKIDDIKNKKTKLDSGMDNLKIDHMENKTKLDELILQYVDLKNTISELQYIPTYINYMKQHCLHWAGKNINALFKVCNAHHQMKLLSNIYGVQYAKSRGCVYNFKEKRCSCGYKSGCGKLSHQTKDIVLNETINDYDGDEKKFKECTDYSYFDKNGVVKNFTYAGVVLFNIESCNPY